jgi:trans-2,3-dihydro-3-hydroxyanthranilate isomerase
MMRYKFYTADVFTDQIFGGNPLAVFPQAAGLKGEQMQQIARELNLPETAFVLPPEAAGATHRVRIFTPQVEMPFAGHPTVGTAYVLAAIGEVSLTGNETQVVFEEGVGLVPVTIRANDGQPTFSQLSAAKMPERGPAPPSLTDLAAMLSLDETDLIGADMPPQAWSGGVPFLFVPLRSRDALARAQVRLEVWQRILKDYWAAQIYVFAHDTDSAALCGRMFAPALGIPEDPATGAAATAITGYLAQNHPTQNGVIGWVIEQGIEMGRPSLMDVEADIEDGAIVAVRVGGASVLVSEGEMTVPE